MKVLVETHVLDIPQRLRELDPELRVVFNTIKQKFEIWGRDLSGPYILGEYNELDYRVIQDVRYGIWRVNNRRKPWQEYVEELRKEKDTILSQHDKALDDMYADDFRNFGKDLYQGFTPTKQVS